MTNGMTRRGFGARVLQAATLAAAARADVHTMTDTQTASPADTRIVRTASPTNLEADFAALDDYVTPVGEHYVRNHFQVPEVDAAAWRLAVEGAVEAPLSLSLDALRGLPAVTRTVTLECAGNGRQFLDPKVSGVQWARGAVSTAEWTGVLVETLLDRAGRTDKAVDLVADGLDRGTPSGSPRPASAISFHRGLPVAEALRRGALVAYAMNGEPLPPLHGFPARLIVPGAYGMASVKWLSRLVVTDAPFEGFWQTTDYAWWDRSGPLPEMRPLLDMQVKSLIAQPSPGGTVPRGTPTTITGAAWSDGAIVRVEVSVDGGRTWADATLRDEALPGVWRRWSHPWTVPASAGRVTLMSRATDSLGRTQPAARNEDYGTYVISHVVRVDVEVA